MQPAVSSTPTNNEAASIDELLSYLHTAAAAGTRAPQPAPLNYGAAQAQGEVLYFLHANPHPPPGFLADLARVWKFKRPSCSSGVRVAEA